MTPAYRRHKARRRHEAKDYTVAGIEISGGVTGEGPIKLGGIDVLVKAKVTLTGTVKPNWPRILAEVGKEGGKQAVKAVATEGGASVVTVDLAAVAGSAAAVWIPALYADE
jgi:hypothetical protein